MRMAVLALAGAMLTQQALAAATNSSVYTDLTLDKCTVIDRNVDEAWAWWRCEGYGGVPVYVAAGDLRYFVSYGAAPREEPAANQTFGRFNRIHDKLEWRLAAGESGIGRPIATILRFFLQTAPVRGLSKGREHPILVVTQIKPGATCHIAYVDAAANPNANLDARAAADRLAGSFDCSSEPELVGPQSPGIFME